MDYRTVAAAKLQMRIPHMRQMSRSRRKKAVGIDFAVYIFGNSVRTAIRPQNIKQEVLIMAELTSPMAGKIQEVNIKVGQMITEDDELFVIEAMKMENVVYGDPGVVKEIFVKAGDRVEEDDPLAVIE